MAYQVSVFLENKIGRLKRVTSVLKENGINIQNMNLIHTANGWGILNLLVSDSQKACEKLGQAGLSASLRKVVALQMQDVPGGLDELLARIADAGVNFTNAYGKVVEPGKKAILFIDAEQIEGIEEKLSAGGLVQLSDDSIFGLNSK